MKNIETIVVTGGCGFIGTNFIRYLFEDIKFKGKIVNIDKLTYAGNPENLSDIASKYKDFYIFENEDICNIECMKKIFRHHNIDVLVNFAAESISEEMIVPIFNGKTFEHYPIKEFFDNLSKEYKIENIDSIEVINLSKNSNFKAIGYDTGMGNLYKIKQISRHKYKGNIVKMTQSMGEVIVTPNHSVLNTMGQIFKPEENQNLLSMRKLNFNSKKILSRLILEIPLANIDSKGYIYFDNKSNIKIKRILENEDLSNFIKLSAMFVAEGFCSYNKKNGSYVIGISNTDTSLINELKTIAESLTTCSWSITNHKKRGYKDCYQLECSSKLIYTLFKNLFGENSKNRRLPSFIYQLSRDNMTILWEYLCKGDGSIINRKYNSFKKYTSTSYKLQCQISLLLTFLKKDYSVYIKDSKENKKWNKSYDIVEINYYNKNLHKNKIEYLDYDGWVYDISVDEVRNFTIGVGNIVVHNSHVDRSIDGPQEFIHTNIIGTFSLLEAFREIHKDKRDILFQHISTDEVYGSLGSTGYFNEITSYNPRSPYSASKASSDHLVKSYYHTYDLPVIVSNCSNNYGPYQFPEKLIPLMIINMLEGKNLPIYGDGQQIRDWLFVKDHCSAIWKIINNGSIGESYNIGGDNEWSNLNLINLLCEVVADNMEVPSINYKKLITFIKDRPGHDRRYAVSSDKLRLELKWKPIMSFYEGLDFTVKWHLKNIDWLKRIKTGEYLNWIERHYANNYK